jgi:enoyl-[acyl-carrier protein] reductase I
MFSFTDKWIYIAGVANKKSVATHVAKILEKQGAKLIFSAQNEKNMASINKIFPNHPVFLFDVESEQDMNELKAKISAHTTILDGFLHSIAFANFSQGPKPFHETLRKDFLQAAHISCFSFTEMSGKIKDLLSQNASCVTVSISSTRATSYGYLGPIKAMLESSCAFLAKSFSEFSKVRFNCVQAGPLKTSASAGIPDYMDNYIFSENLTLRKESLQTQEVANTITFLLSELSSGINAGGIIIDAGMSANYFDQEIVKTYVKSKF